MAYNYNNSSEDNAYEDEYVSLGGIKMNCVLSLKELVSGFDVLTFLQIKKFVIKIHQT